MKEYIYIVQNGNSLVGYITKDEFDGLQKEGLIDYYNGDENFPMIVDEESDKYLSLTKAYNTCQ